jgi:hypothetical protein
MKRVGVRISVSRRHTKNEQSDRFGSDAERLGVCFFRNSFDLFFVAGGEELE